MDCPSNILNNANFIKACEMQPKGLNSRNWFYKIVNNEKSNTHSPDTDNYRNGRIAVSRSSFTMGE